MSIWNLSLANKDTFCVRESVHHPFLLKAKICFVKLYVLLRQRIDDPTHNHADCYGSNHHSACAQLTFSQNIEELQRRAVLLIHTYGSYRLQYVGDGSKPFSSHMYAMRLLSQYRRRFKGGTRWASSLRSQFPARRLMRSTRWPCGRP